MSTVGIGAYDLLHEPEEVCGCMGRAEPVGHLPVTTANAANWSRTYAADGHARDALRVWRRGQSVVF